MVSCLAASFVETGSIACLIVQPLARLFVAHSRRSPHLLTVFRG